MVTPSIPQPTDDESRGALISPRPPPEPAWGLLDVIGFGVLGIVLTLILTLMFMVLTVVWLTVHGGAPPDAKFSIAIFSRAALPAQFIAYGFTILVVKLVLAERGHPQMMRALSWNWPRWQVAAKIVALAIATAYLASNATRYFNVPPDAPILEMLKDRVVARMFFVFGVTFGPFAEEFYFRGLLYPSLQRRIGGVGAVLVTSLLFALIHASQLANSLGPIGLLFIVGAIMTMIRAYTGSLASSFVFHVVYNAILILGGSFFHP